MTREQIIRNHMAGKPVYGYIPGQEQPKLGKVLEGTYHDVFYAEGGPGYDAGPFHYELDETSAIESYNRETKEIIAGKRALCEKECSRLERMLIKLAGRSASGSTRQYKEPAEPCF